MNRKSHWHLGLVLCVAAIGQLIVGATPAAASRDVPNISQGQPEAFTGSSAVAYAESWVDHTWTCNGNHSACVQKRNPAYSNLEPEDCTNFVSQALAAGGFHQTNGGLGTTTHYEEWFYQGSLRSNSWGVAPILLNFLYVHNPGGILTAFWSPNPGNNQLSGTKPGGVVFYDWGWNGGNLGVSHASMVVVANGTDPYSGWKGDLVDMHDTDRYHAYWTLEPYLGSNAASVAYTVVGISVKN